MKIAVATTFPLDYWNVCAAEMVASFQQNWPEKCTLFVGLDNLPQETFAEYHQKLTDVSRSNMLFVSNDFDKQQLDFLERHKNDEQPQDYRFQCVRFSYKIFNLYRTAMHAKQQGYDYVIWLDADVITKKAIKMKDLQKWLPNEDQVVSCLDRIEMAHSECGFVAYRLDDTGVKLLTEMRNMYIDDSVLSLSGWTDCHVFDHLRKTHGYKSKNLSEGLPGHHVWNLSPLGQFMEHHKGNRKFNDGLKATPKKQKPQKQQAMSLDSMDIRTKNCVDHTVILDQIKQNIMQINTWVNICKFNDEEVVIASAGDSLCRDDIMPYYERGVKIVAVKHAVERLLEWGIKPWACVLLDPRPHVENFVKKPDKDIIYLVASMVHPSVVKTLLDNKCKVIGYHALVGAKEETVLRSNDFLVSGGSATATRSIGLLNEVFGFKKFHCYGYDLCHYSKPDMVEKTEDGNQKYFEIELTIQTWGNRTVKKTFWTEGQFLAQSKELADLYKSNKDIKIVVYGDGMAGWNYRHWMQYKAWASKFDDVLAMKREKGFSVNDWISANA